MERCPKCGCTVILSVEIGYEDDPTPMLECAGCGHIEDDDTRS
jgi:uncharacterized Zn finger protein